jgi:hypothetical protein
MISETRRNFLLQVIKSGSLPNYNTHVTRSVFYSSKDDIATWIREFLDSGELAMVGDSRSIYSAIVLGISICKQTTTPHRKLEELLSDLFGAISLESSHEDHKL